jgi:hypothetical protein
MLFFIKKEKKKKKNIFIKKALHAYKIKIKAKLCFTSELERREAL